MSIWNHYEKFPESPGIARCVRCQKEYSYKTTTTNLKKHLKCKHFSAYQNFMNENKGEAIYIINADDAGDEQQTSGVDQEMEESSASETEAVPQSDQEVKRPQRLKILKRLKQRKPRVKGLIEQLTEEKISVTSLQKVLVEKEIQEKDMKLKMLQDEMQHKKELYELEKQEMLLRLELLKTNIGSAKTGINLPNIVVTS